VEATRFEREHAGPAHPPLRIGFASDFHAGPTTHPSVLACAIEELANADLDVLLLGGDFISLDARFIDPLAERLGEVPARLGRYAVLGNHDLWVDHAYVQGRLERAGIEMLTNSNRALPPPYDAVSICGLDDHGSGRPDAEAAFEGAGGVRVVLMHAPSSLLDIGEHRFDLAFCGHTHGGQIALPSGRPMIVPEGRLSRRYCRGAHELSGERFLYVSRGVGCSTVPLRAWSSPEVVICTLRASTRSP
jgi:predicted MPP superfamily phosphohydrolase